MRQIKRFVSGLNKSQKIVFLSFIIGLILFVSIGIPTFARFKHRNIVTNLVWDGTVATSYKKGIGTSSDPYIISNGSELAYFSNELANNTYEGLYFSLSDDIVLNNGVFKYDQEQGILYILNGTTYYVEEYTNKYYSDIEKTNEAGSINVFPSLNNFKGYFNGNSYRIYGSYITSETSEELALFTNMQGSITDLYVENSLIYGGKVTAGITSTSTNATIKNALFNGYVIGKNSDLSKLSTSNLEDVEINMSSLETITNLDLSNYIPYEGGEILNTSITGNYTISGATENETSISINGVTLSNGSFEINLGTTVLNNLSVITRSLDGASLTLSNISYNVNYNYGVSGGITAIANNTTFENTVNKGYIYGYSVAGGLIGTMVNTAHINQSYNTGNVSSNIIGGGLVGTIEKNTTSATLSKDYNNGIITGTKIGGLVGTITNNTSPILIDKTFDTSDIYTIGTINNTSVNINNSYYVSLVSAIEEDNGIVLGQFNTVTVSDLQIKTNMVNNLFYDEFTDFNNLLINNEDVWVYNDESLPILFIDDINNPIANLHANIYSWDNFSPEISEVKLSSNITFSIEETDELRPIKEIYYYISNSVTPLTLNEIKNIGTWNIYSNIVQISDEGFYIIYAKVIDYNDNIFYINSDLLILDLPGASATINMETRQWTELQSNPEKIYIDGPKEITVTESDTISGISSIGYYITDTLLSTNDLNNLSDDKWTSYSAEENILINTNGIHIIYIKIMDNFNYASYLSTDYLIFDGYSQNSFTIGRNSSSYIEDGNNITDKSSIMMNFTYTSTTELDYSNHTHNLVSNILLPLGSKITLIDYITNNVYEYVVNTSEDNYGYEESCPVEDTNCIKKATYPFTLFKEVGTGSTIKYFGESTYTNNSEVNENFSIILDLSNTEINVNYSDVSMQIQLNNQSGNTVRPTLNNTISKFNIYSVIDDQSSSAYLNISTSYTGNPIVLNSDSVTTIPLNSNIVYKYLDTHKIIDTKYEDKETGLSIKLVDSNGTSLGSEYLKNMVFKIGENVYYPGKDNIIRINLGSALQDYTKELKVTTYDNNSNLAYGTYYLKITNYVAFDGYYSNEINTNEIIIPVTVTNTNLNNIEYGFDVNMNSEDRIISKTNTTVDVELNIEQNGLLSDPNIRVSLYKKDLLTAYNQNYSIVNLASYVTNTLVSASDNVYYLSTDPNQYNQFIITLITSNFENTGYKYVFELYDGNKKIGTIDKYFIVK